MCLPAYTHTHVRTHTHTLLHMQLHAHTHTHTHSTRTQVHTRIRARVYSTNPCSCTLAHTHSYACTYAHTHTHSHTYIRTHKHTSTLPERSILHDSLGAGEDGLAGPLTQWMEKHTPALVLQWNLKRMLLLAEALHAKVGCVCLCVCIIMGCGVHE
jgi:hypothetical protein